MYEVFPHLKQPDDDALLWRYMSLANFVALLVERYLFFSRLDGLEDPFEGVPDFTVAGVMQVTNRMTPGPNADPRGLAALNRWREVVQTCRRRIHVNCWHVSHYESEAMWKLYGRLGENIAIVSNLASLRECFSQSPTVVTGALVEYEDEATRSFGGILKIDRDTMCKWASRKRASYEHEREFRLIHVHDDDPTSTATGTHFAVEPAKFVKEVVLSPLMPPWQVLTLHNLIYKLGYELKIRESSLLTRLY